MKQTVSSFLLSAAVIAALLFPACTAENLVSLKFNPPKDKKLEYKMTMEQDMEMEQGGQKMNMKNLMDFTYDMTVKSKDAKNNTEMISTFRKIKLSMNMGPMMKIDYDSENPDKDTSNMFAAMFSRVFGNMIGKSVSFTVSEKGEVVSLKGMEAIFNEILSSTGLDSMPGASAVVQNMKSQYTDEKFKKNFETMFHILPDPDKEVSVGDSWDVTAKNDLMDMGMETKTTYTLKDINSKTADVDMAADLNIDKGVNGTEMKMSGKQTGNMKVDLATGLPTSGEIKHDMTMTTSANGMEIPMKIKGTIKISSKEK